MHEAAILKGKSVPVFNRKARLFHYSGQPIQGSLQKLALFAQLGVLKCLKSRTEVSYGDWGQR
jgi:hypothetical protein